MPQNILSKNVYDILYEVGDGKKVILFDINDLPNEPEDGGITRSSNESGFSVMSNKDITVHFRYEENGTYVNDGGMHHIVLEKNQMENDVVQVPWLVHGVYGKPTHVWFEAVAADQMLRILPIDGTLNHDGNFGDGENDSDFLSFFSNSIQMGTVGKAYSTIVTENEYGYRAIRHKNINLVPNENIEVTVDGIVDHVAILENNIKSIEYNLDKDIVNEITTISFTVPGDYDNDISDNNIVTWYSVGNNIENLEFTIYVGNGSLDGSTAGTSQSFTIQTQGFDDLFFGRYHGGNETQAAIDARTNAGTDLNWELFKFDFTIDWGDGTVEACDAMYTNGNGELDQYPFGVNFTHNYNSSGFYKISVGGAPQALNIGTGSDDGIKLRSITQWGTHRWKRLPSWGWSNVYPIHLDVTAVDQPLVFGADDYVDPDGNITFNSEGRFVSNFDANAKWDAESSFSYLFYEFQNLTNENNSLSNWDLGKILNKDRINFSSNNETPGLSLSHTFYNCKKYQPINFNNWATYFSDNNISITKMLNTFHGCNLFNAEVNNLPVNVETSNNAIFDGVFNGCESFNQPVSNWNVTNSISFNSVFKDCKIFNQDLSSWNVSNSADFQYTFKGCESFNQNLSTWTNTNDLYINGMFEGCLDFNNGGSGNSMPEWTIMSAGSTFKNCESFNPSNDLKWNTDNCDNLSSIFEGCSVFNPLKVRTLNPYWNTGNVIHFDSAFKECKGATYAGAGPNGWDISSARNLNNMFANSNITSTFQNWDFSQLGLNYINPLSQIYSGFGTPGTTTSIAVWYEDGSNPTLAYPLFMGPGGPWTYPYQDFFSDAANGEKHGGWMLNFYTGVELFHSSYEALLAKLANELVDLVALNNDEEDPFNSSNDFEVAIANTVGSGGTYFGRIDMGNSKRNQNAQAYYEAILDKGWYIFDGGQL